MAKLKKACVSLWHFPQSAAAAFTTAYLQDLIEKTESLCYTLYLCRAFSEMEKSPNIKWEKSIGKKDAAKAFMALRQLLERAAMTAMASDVYAADAHQQTQYASLKKLRPPDMKKSAEKI